MKWTRRLPFALASLFVSVLARFVPPDERGRWREEWRGELAHADEKKLLSSGRVIRMAAGAVPDAVATRRLHAPPTSASGRRRPFQAIDQDLRFACRGLVKSPRFTIGVVCSLAVGIAANAAAFSLLNAVFFRPFPGVRDQDELVTIKVQRNINGLPYGGASYDAYIALREGMSSLSGLAANRPARFAVSFNNEAVALDGALVSWNYFDVLEVRPVAGRVFTGDDEREAWTHPAAIISDSVWSSHFNRSPDAIGQFITVNGAALRILGVAPERFIGLTLPDYGECNIWIPLALGELALRDQAERPVSPQDTSSHFFGFTGRRRPGVAVEQVQAEAAVITERLSLRQPHERRPLTAIVGTLEPGLEELAIMIGFMAVPLIVLVIACVNTANLLLARSRRSSRDWTTRLTLGATRWRVVRQVLVESLLLALAAAAAGLFATSWMIAILEQYVPLTVEIDRRVLLFTLATAAATALAFGIAPAWRAASQDGSLAARGSARPSRSHMRRALVVLQTGLSLALLATGTQFLKTVHSRIEGDGLVQPERLLVASFDVGRLRRTPEAVEDFYARLLDRVSLQRGVISAALTCECVPWGAWSSVSGLRVWLPDDKPGSPRSTLAMYATGRVFEALNLQMLDGRTFRDSDRGASTHALVVNRPFAEKVFAGQAIGRTLRIAGRRDDYGSGSDAVIVGVVAAPTVKRADSLPMVYYATPLRPLPAQRLYVRLDGPAADAIPALRAAVREVDPDVPFVRLATAADLREERNAPQRFLAVSVAGLGLLALVLAATGLYGVVSYGVTLRTQEIGVRIALGARPRDVLTMILRQALTPAAIGAVLGGGGAAAVGAIVRSRLYGASLVDPVASRRQRVCCLERCCWRVPCRRGAHRESIRSSCCARSEVHHELRRLMSSTTRRLQDDDHAGHDDAH